MKIKRLQTVLIMISVFALQLSLNAQKSYKSTTKSTMSVYGTSTLHDWHMNLEHLTCDAKFTVGENVVEAINSFSFSCKSKDLKSGKSRMDNLAWEALKADNHPYIKATMKSIKLFTPSGNSFKAIVMANVTIAGVTQLTPIAVKGEILADGKIKVLGNKEINMPDYDMEAPTAMMGTIKTGDKITLVFSMEFI